MKFIDLFAGIGGFRLGMELAGHTAVGWCEIDKYAQKSYRAMHNTEGEWFADDIFNVTDEHIRQLRGGRGPIEVITGGFPCQAFSVAGKRGGFEDIRGTLFFEIVRFASILRPCYLFLENVPGLLNHDNGNTFEVILRALDEVGYDAEWDCLNSKDFGVPQNRERVFIIGHLRGRSTRKVFPIERGSGETIKQLIGGKQGYEVYDTAGASTTITSQTGGLGRNSGLYMISVDNGKLRQKANAECLDANYFKGINNNQARTGVLEYRPCLTPERAETRQQGRRLKEDGEPMFTLTGQDVHGVYNGCRIRLLTPLECWRLQGFPDEYFYKAQKVNSDSQLYKQAGNSVTVNVIYEIARRLVAGK